MLNVRISCGYYRQIKPCPAFAATYISYSLLLILCTVPLHAVSYLSCLYYNTEFYFVNTFFEKIFIFLLEIII